MKGLYGKYTITKTSGKPLDEGFYAIVLRVDGGRYVDACRIGVAAFAEAVREQNPRLALDIRSMLDGYRDDFHASTKWMEAEDDREEKIIKS